MNKIYRYVLVLLFTAGCVATAAAQPAAFPSPRPVKIVAPYAPGGTGDTLSRILAEKLALVWQTPAVVENRPGGSAVVATQMIANSPGDGHTLLVSASNFTINPFLLSKLPYDSARDFAPVALLATNPHILIVNPSVPARNLKEFIAWAKAKKGAGTYASFGNGTSGHLGFERFKHATGVDMIHVPYKGAVPAISDLMSGQVDAMFCDTQQVLQFLPSGKIRAIASASATRAATLPEVQTFAEGGVPGFISTSWFGLIAKADTPPAVLAEINRDVIKVLQQPEVKARLYTMGVDAVGSSQKDFGAFLQNNTREYGDIIRSAGIRAE
ncbi:tripartite tricarboxylate transporter substrate binding protein [Variovorax sp. LT1R20]|uniref:tripartite tricarboxylate transporter substrate binding protein n=1 Tax=Variovorax sp. LT1R20 TaxID=3443729 RepID=UPI003F491FC6